MHFSTAALLALSSVGLTYAAPFANLENEDLVRRDATYSVVNVDGLLGLSYFFDSASIAFS